MTWCVFPENIHNLLVFTKSLDRAQFLHVLIGSHKSEYPWIFTVLWLVNQNGISFHTVSEDKILVISN